MGVIAVMQVALALSGAAEAQEIKGGKLPWFKGTPEQGLALAKKEKKRAFMYFTSKG